MRHYTYHKKGILLRVLPLFMIMCLLGGCGGKNENSGDSTDAQPVDCAALVNDMMAADTTLPEMTVVTDADEKGELNFGGFSDFDYDRVAGYAYAYATDGGSQEIAVIRLKDSGDAAALMSTLKDHLGLRRGALGEYAPDQLTLIEHAVVRQKDDLVAMIICEKSGLAQQVFDAYE
jgi:hypothetical protein